MAETQPYLPSMPTLTSGVAPINNSVGNTFRALAEDIGQARQQVAQTNMSRAALFGNLLGTVAGGVEQAIGRHLTTVRKAQYQQQQMLGDAAVANSMYDLTAVSDKARGVLQQNLADDPMQAPGQLRDLMESERDLHYEKLKKTYGPDVAYKFRAQALVHTNAEVDKLNSWSLSQQGSNTASSVNTAIDNEVTQIANATGTIDDKINGYLESVKRTATMANQQQHVLGKQNVDIAIKKTALQGGVALFQNLATSPPDDPEQRLTYAQQVGTLLANSDKYGIPLAGSDRVHLQSMVNSMVGQYERDLTQHLEVQDIQKDFEVRVYQNQVSQNRDNAPLLQGAITFAGQQIQALKARVDTVVNDPSKPERVKNAYVKTLAAQTAPLEALTKHAQSMLDRIESEHKADERAAIAESNAASRELKHQQNEAQRVAREQLKESQTDAKSSAYTMRETLWRLAQNPADNMPEILSKAKEGYDYVNKMEAAGYLSPSQAHSDRQSMLSIATNAATYQRSAPPLWGVFSSITGPMPVKKQTGQQAIDARKGALTAIIGSAQRLQDTNTQTQINDIAGLNAEQQNLYHRNESILFDLAAKNSWTPTQLKQKQNDLRSAVLQSLPAKPAAPKPLQGKIGISDGYASVKDFPGLIEKGNIDLTKRQIVDNPDGSYGTEFSVSFNDGRNEVLIPTIYDGKHHSTREAIEHYKSTGEHMGKFAIGDIKHINEYAEKIHSRVITHNGVPYHGAPHQPAKARAHPQNFMVPPPPPMTPGIGSLGGKMTRAEAMAQFGIQITD